MTPYTSSLLADLSDGALVSVYIVGVCAAAGIGAWVVVYGWPALMDWLLPRLARWHARQVIKANEPQPYPPSSDALALAIAYPVLVILALAVVARREE